MTPTFICVGAAKSGTTSFHYILSQHPEILIPQEKDFHFFDDQQNYSKGIDWYNRFFKNGNSKQKIAGEIAATYLYDPLAPQRILETLGPDCKLIFILRNPSKRSYSEYLHHYRRGNLKKTYRDYLEQNFDSNCYSKDPNHLLIERSCYSRYIENYLKYFSKDQMKFIIMEELFTNGEVVMRKINKFLEVSDFSYNWEMKINEGFVPVSVRFNKMLHSKSVWKSILIKILPSYLMRRQIKLWLQMINRSNAKKQNSKLKPKEYREINSNFFKDEIQKLELIIENPLNIWDL